MFFFFFFILHSFLAGIISGQSSIFQKLLAQNNKYFFVLGARKKSSLALCVKKGKGSRSDLKKFLIFNKASNYARGNFFFFLSISYLFEKIKLKS